MKETLVKVIALLGLVAILGLTACPAGPSTSSTASTTSVVASSSTVATITIYVAVISNATNLYDSVGKFTNDIYLVGGFGTNKQFAPTNDLTNYFGDWSASDTKPKLVAAGTTNGVPMYVITFANLAKSNTTISCKFVNGTPGVGGDWANAEKTASGGEIVNRTVDVIAGSNVVKYFVSTNTVSGNDTNVGSTGIQAWAGVNPTYKVTNVTIVVICTNTTAAPAGDVAANYAFVGSVGGLSVSGTNTWGDITGRSDNRTVTLASGVISLSFTHSGGAAVAIKLQAKKLDASWSWGDGANVQSAFGVPIALTNGGTLTNIYANPAVVW